MGDATPKFPVPRVDNIQGDNQPTPGFVGLLFHRSSGDPPRLVWVLKETEAGWEVQRMQDNPDMPPPKVEFLPRTDWTRMESEVKAYHVELDTPGESFDPQF